jgi:RNA polymerase sigma factor (sigma-70 family)
MPWAGVISEIRNGNELSAGPLYAAVSNCAKAQLYHSVDSQMVEDYVQEILLIVQAALRGGELRDPHCLMGFVRTVTRRQVADHIRWSISRRRTTTQLDATFGGAAPARESPEARLCDKERTATLRRVLGLIRPRDREILERFYCEEQIPEQICHDMKITATQFRLYKSRALARCYALSQRPHRVFGQLVAPPAA